MSDDSFDLFAFIAERRIREAIQQGKLDNLPGKGKPLQLEDPPPGVPREVWLMMKLLKGAGVKPREVELLKEVHELKESIRNAKSEPERKKLVGELRRKEVEAIEALERFNRGKS